MVLKNLNADDFRYPEFVPITEIGGYSFISFYCNGGIGQGIDIGKNGELGKIIGKKFNSAKDVIHNYDIILRTVKNLKMSPEINHFENDNSESYLLVENNKSTDQSSIYNLIGVENKFAFAKTLVWNRSDCYFNTSK